MNSLMKLLVLSTLIIFIMSSASAAVTTVDLNAWDANNSRHANVGEDFNIIIPQAFVSDINSDFNYLIALNYEGTYVDLNVNVLGGTAMAASWNTTLATNDANSGSRTLSGTGPCANAGDVNVIVFDPRSDLNIFNVTVTLPSTGKIKHLIGKAVMIEIWPLVGSSTRASTCGATKVADGNFIIGPAIIAYTPNASNEVGIIDQDITIFGFGFTPSPSTGMDNNVEIFIYDANGIGMYDVNYPGDMNISKAYASASVSLLGIFHRLRTDLDTNATVLDLNSAGPGVAGWENLWPMGTMDWNGITVYPDANGEFDVNLNIPYVSATGGSTIGRNDLNTLRAHSTADGDVNAVFIIAPKLSLAGDMNAVVTIGGTVYDLNTAILNRTISNIQAVSNLIIKMGTLINGDGATRQINVAFNADTNFGINSILNMGTDFNGRSGYVDIDTNKIANGGIDATVTMYDVNIGSATTPFVLKDGQPCSSTVCTSQSWAYETAAGDGNLSFTVAAFSNYEASPFTIEMVAPLGGERIRTPRNNADTNYQIQFRFKDLNTADSNSTPLRGIITYATKRGANTGVIFYDVNLFDATGIRCNGYDNIDSTTDLSTWNNCVFDWNRSDLNSLVGEYVIDVNIATPAGRIFEQSALTGTDSNVYINPPLIEITDANINDGNYVTNRGVWPSGGAQGVFDINYVVDFNIYLPDLNSDQNFTLADYNIHFFLGPTQTSIGVGLGVSDINSNGTEQMADQNFQLGMAREWITSTSVSALGIDINCTQPPAATPYFDYNCRMQYDTNGVYTQGKNYLTVRLVNNVAKTTYYSSVTGAGTLGSVLNTVDVNESWDINASKYEFSINDNNVPRATFGTTGNYGSITTSVSGSEYTTTITCDDNTSGPAYYYYRESGGTWSTGSQYDNTVTITNNSDKTVTKTYEGGCKDYAGNTSDINAQITVTLSPKGSRTPPPSPGPSGGPGLPPITVEGTETILVIEIQGTAPVENITETLTEAGFTEEEIATATIVVSSTPVDQTVGVDKITNEAGATYQTWVSLKVTNTSNKKWKNVKVIVDIPKGIASNASHINSEYSMTVLKADPIIEFTIPEIQVGETANLRYTTDKQISDVTARLLPIGMVTAYTEVAPCDGVNCETQVCATGGCNPATGQCEYDYYADGTSCGTGKECQSGTCVDKPTPPVITPPIIPEPPVDYTLPIVAIIIIIIVIAGTVYYKKEKGK